MITAEKKMKYRKDGEPRMYTYYRCTKKKTQCSQRYVGNKDLEKQILSILETIEAPIKFHRFARKWLRRTNTQGKEKETINQSLKRAYDSCEQKLNTLIDMRVNHEITEEQFLTRKSALSKEKRGLEQAM